MTRPTLPRLALTAVERMVPVGTCVRACAVRDYLHGPMRGEIDGIRATIGSVGSAICHLVDRGLLVRVGTRRSARFYRSDAPWTERVNWGPKKKPEAVPRWVWPQELDAFVYRA